jgi:hypothetical protein
MSKLDFLTKSQTSRWTDLMAMAASGLLAMRKDGKALLFTPAPDLGERLDAR